METRPTPPPRRPTIFGDRGGGTEVIGLKSNLFADAYNLLLRVSWLTVILGFIGLFLGTNVLFGALYAVVGGVEHARPGNFRDAFFFSVQTLGTIGYGEMYPTGDGAQFLVTAEVMIGILQMALVTGLVFSKFSRPVARVMFSKNVVVAPIDDQPTLMLRAANARGNNVVDAEAILALIRWEITPEGTSLYRIHDLKLVRHRSPAFRNTWLLMHRIDEDSPLFGATEQGLRDQNVELALTLIGMDGTTSQNIHASYSYLAEDFRFGERFADMLSDLPGGGIRLDFTKFDVTEKV